MRAGPPDEVLSGAPVWRPRVTAWLGGTLLAASVPIASGRVTAKVTDDKISSLTLQVPRFASPAEGEDVVDWRPSTPVSPLARFGQALDVSVSVTSVITGQTWETRIGRFQISDWDDSDGGMITVKGESLLARIADDQLRALTSPQGTFISESRRLLPAGMGVSFDAALIDRPMPQTLAWSTDRLKNLKEIALAWPAVLRIDEWGQLTFRAPLPAVPAPVVNLTDGASGTLIAAPRSDTRADACNVVIVSSSNTDTPDVQGEAEITSGPMSSSGAYGGVVKRWSTPLVRSTAEAAAAAATDLANSIRPAQSVPVRIAPDPRIDLDDAVSIARGTDDPLWGWVTAYDLPLTAADGDMRIDVGVPT